MDTNFELNEEKNTDNYLVKKIRYLEWGTKRCPAKIRKKRFQNFMKDLS